MTQILIIEDNPDLAFGLRRTLEFEGYEVVVAEDGEKGLTSARDDSPEIVILDLMLPDMDGFRILRELRGSGLRVPVLILTARSDEADVIMGFDSGADDYVTKPFSTLEVLARVRALLRRGTTNGAGADSGTSRFGKVEVDPSARTVVRDGEDICQQ
jgi:DNA-binding response OmpR family regulator